MMIPVEMCKRPCWRIVTVWYAQWDVFEHLEIVEMLAYWSDISFGCCSTAGRLMLKGVPDTQWIQWHVPWERANVHGISLPGQWWVFFIPFRTIAPSSCCELRVCGYALASMLFVNRTSYPFAKKMHGSDIYLFHLVSVLTAALFWGSNAKKNCPSTPPLHEISPQPSNRFFGRWWLEEGPPICRLFQHAHRKVSM